MHLLASGALTLLGYVPYILSIARGHTRPSRISWWVWSGVGALLLSTYVGLGARAGLGLAIGALAGQIVIALLSLRVGEGGATTLDRLCLAGAAACGILWWLTASPLLPHLLILAMDFLGWLPTFRKTLRHPASENALSWGLWCAGAGVALLNGSPWMQIGMLYPLYLVVTDGVILLVTLRVRADQRSDATKHD